MTIRSCFVPMPRWGPWSSHGGHRHFWCGVPRIVSNSAELGGGIYCTEASSPTLRGATLSGNSAKGSGGAVACSLTSFPAFEDSLLTGNSAWKNGGALYSLQSFPTLTDCLLSDNSAKRGGAVHCGSQSSLILENVTFHGNEAGISGGAIYCEGSYATVANTILWNDTAAQTGPEISLLQNGAASFLDIRCSDVKNGASSVLVDAGCTMNWNEGMIDDDPCFVDPEGGDFHLLYPSPCRNAGSDAAVTRPLDFEGDPRIAYGQVDIGFDEFHPRLYITGETAPGQAIAVKLIGLPKQEATLYLGAGVLEEARKTPYGPWFLLNPCTAFPLGEMPWTGLIETPSRIPTDVHAPLALPLQGCVRRLTNLCVLELPSSY